MKAVVKNSFLEFVDAGDDDEVQPRILTSQTDSKALGIWNCRDGMLGLEDEDSSDSGAGDANDATKVAAKIAAALAVAEAASAADAAEAAAAAGHAPSVAADATAATAHAASAAADAAFEAADAAPAAAEAASAAGAAAEDAIIIAEGAGRATPQPAGAPGVDECLKPLPDLGMSSQLIVKNTFLELPDEEDEPQGKITKSSTDSAALLRCNLLPEELDGLREEFQSRLSGFSIKIKADAEVPKAVTAEPAVDAMKNLLPVPRRRETGTGCMSPVAEEPSFQSFQSAAENSFGQVAAMPPVAALTYQDPSPAAVSKCSPRAANGNVILLSQGIADGPTTLMLRNVPNDYTRGMLLELLDAMGFQGRYNFIYYPTDFSRRAGLGYAFLNMLTAEDSRQVGVVLEGFRRWSVPSSKVCSVSWNVPCQGLEANIERYRSSPIMHKSVMDEFKPAVFKDGERVPFPKPTRKIRKPDARRGGC